MKNTFFAVFLCLFAQTLCFAQIPETVDENRLVVANYPGNAVVVLLSRDSALVQKDSALKRLAILTEGQFVYLKNKRENEQLLRTLQLSKDEVERAFPMHSHLLPIERLLTAAAQYPDQKLWITAEDAGLEGSVLDSDSADKESERARTEATTASKGISWATAAALILASFLTGLLLSNILRKKKQPKNVPAPTVGDAKDWKAAHERIEAENQFLQGRMSRALMQLEDTKTFDHEYFHQAFTQIIVPLQESLAKADRAQTIRLITIAAAQMSSIARMKVGTKQLHDEANIQALRTGNRQMAQNFPQISKETPVDKIPKNLEVLLHLLKENHVQGLEDTVVMGYRIKDLY